MAGDIKYRDVNRDGQVTSLDMVPIGYPTVPEIVYGFGLSAGYKNFDISAFFQGLGRESFRIGVQSTFPFADNRQLLKANGNRSEEHTSELQSLMRISYAVFCLKKKNKNRKHK